MLSVFHLGTPLALCVAEVHTMKRKRPSSRQTTNTESCSVEALEPRVVMDGDWSAASGAGVSGSWGDGGYLTVTTIDLNDQPIVFERVRGTSSDNGTIRSWQELSRLTTPDGSTGADSGVWGRHSLAVHDDRMIIGAPDADGGAGAAAVFHYSQSSGAWVLETVLTAPGGHAGDGFGWAVDLHGGTAVIGTRSGGAAYVYGDSSGWTLRATLAPDSGLAAGGLGSRFGFSVATDGSVIAVGAPGEESVDGDVSATSGAVYLFDRDGNQWDVRTRIGAPTSARDAEFGNSVAVHSSNVIVGAWLDDDRGVDSGSVFAIGRGRAGWQIEAKLTPTTDAPGARYGSDVAASGSRGAVIAIGSDDGATLPFAQVLKRSGDRWRVEQVLSPTAAGEADLGWRSVAFQGDRIALGSDASGGSAMLFRQIPGTDVWTHEATLTPTDAGSARSIGFDVALHDRTVFLGARFTNNTNDSLAAGAWVFRGSGNASGDSASGVPNPSGPGDESGGGNGTDDGTGHDQNDDNGGGGNGTDDGTGHDQNDDNGGGGNGTDDGTGHDQNDDNGGGGNGTDDGTGHDQNDDNGGGGNGTDDGGTGQSAWRWTVRGLGSLPGVGTPLSDILTWTDPKDGQTYAALATPEGLMLFTRSADRSVWTVRNLSTEITGAEVISGAISVFGTRSGLVSIVGSNAAGDMIIFRQTGAGGGGEFDWSFQNITTTDLAPRGLETPHFAGGVVTFVTRWGALNIAGLDDHGHVRAVWTTPAIGHWRSDDLSASAGTPVLDGKLAVFLTPWGGINLAATDTSGALSVTWWVPGFERWVVSDFNALFDGPSLAPDSVSAFATPWGGLNIVGRDDHGDLVAYWWVPEFGKHREDDYWRVSNLSQTIVASDQPVGPISGLVTADGEINLFGANAVNDVIRYFWRADSQWSMENLTHTATPV
ncbi:MAG: FG-GAP repeat protein [Phycisphaerales bacterium]|nr:FG-GAP repeat protein [Phycisphaerales bacterium]